MSRTILMIGGNSGIGLATARLLQAQGLSFHASIAAAKGAVEGLTRSLAAELAPKIRVNAIAPSLTDTPLAGNLLNSDVKMEAASKFLTGQILRPDGGLSSVRTF